MIINEQTLVNLGACDSGFVNFITKYPGQSFSLSDALQLTVPYSDKRWLIGKVVEESKVRLWIEKCLDHVKNNYTLEDQSAVGLGSDKIDALLELKYSGSDLFYPAAETYIRLLADISLDRQDIFIGILVNEVRV